ncbi:MAG: hypothetical protein NT001_05575 [Candidatus Woesearchaeota archaeon]|nr:hypothetical protein [Candidatus Woesearchaeota archaeon]
MNRAIKKGLWVLASLYALNFWYHAAKAFPDLNEYSKASNQYAKIGMCLPTLQSQLSNCRDDVCTKKYSTLLDKCSSELRPFEQEEEEHGERFSAEMAKGMIPWYALRD